MKPRAEALPEGKGGRFFSVDFEAIKREALERIDGVVSATEAIVEPLRANPERETLSQARTRGRVLAEHTARLARLETERAGVLARPVRPPHWFRVPIPSRIEAMVEFRATRGTGERASLEQGAIAIGACWYHQILAFEATWPVDPTPEALASYAEAIQEELADRGYSEAEITDLAAEVLRHLARRNRDHGEARKLVGFSEPPRTATSG